MEGSPICARRSWMASRASWRMNASIFFTSSLSLRGGGGVGGRRGRRAGGRRGGWRGGGRLRLGAGDVDEPLRVAEHRVLRDVQAAQLVLLADPQADRVLDGQEDEEGRREREADGRGDAVELHPQLAGVALGEQPALADGERRR